MYLTEARNNKTEATPPFPLAARSVHCNCLCGVQLLRRLACLRTQACTTSSDAGCDASTLARLKLNSVTSRIVGIEESTISINMDYGHFD